MPLYTSLINKAKLGLATGFSVETVALFLCTEEVVCVHREGKKKTQNTTIRNTQSSPVH